MTTYIVGRPRRTRPTDRVNYKLDSDIRSLLSEIAEDEGRNEGAQVEQLILFYAAYQELNRAGVVPTLDAVTAKMREIRDNLVQAEAND